MKRLFWTLFFVYLAGVPISAASFDSLVCQRMQDPKNRETCFAGNASLSILWPFSVVYLGTRFILGDRVRVV
jgi:hypothetical protein